MSKISAKLIVTLAVFFLTSMAGICQINWIKSDTFVPNIESTYHVLHTANSIKEGSAKSHLFLPSVTLGSPRDKNIHWGATLPTREGDMIYTSFYSPAFLAPIAWEKLTNIALTVSSLAAFNFLIGSITAFLVSFLVLDILEFCGFRAILCSIGAVLASTIAIFSQECLISHGILYWAQSLYQLNLALSLTVTFKFIKHEALDRSKSLDLLHEWEGMCQLGIKACNYW